ncbi:PhnB protein [Salirhabdus euzebyi]|uniref:PhnB protein n=1 Tax=Salirhabdus euzebyi TaxID=394506 RepID=A0A841PXW5_9BACI|nr:VOC family protein [Salirhabdus euzebyi]MBB6452376.1 PhnB protein [Salirhabdus euzebyi]
MNRIIPHIFIENCKEAISFYHDIFGGEIRNIQLSDGIEMFKGQEGKYIHAELHINERSVLYFADVFGETVKGSNIWLSLDIESEKELNNTYQALLKEGMVKQKLKETFWGAIYAVITDKYGLTWELNCTKQ